jgi:GNAT superfamily N-acetyltransferase
MSDTHREGTVEDGVTATLRDGVVVAVRRLSAEDFDRVLELTDTLSDDERYFRFFTVHPGYVAEWAQSLTEPAPGVVALGAFDHGELVGVANYAPSNQPGQVEIAVVVAHDQHDRGVGTVLLGELVRIARLHHERHLVADVLAENAEMRRVITDSHVPVRIHRDGSVLSVDVNLETLNDS